MVRDLSYILKRIIIGVGIALVLAFLRGTLFIKVSALGVASGDIGVHVTNITPQTNNFEFDVSPAPFSAYSNTSGYIYLPIAITKNGGTSTEPFPTIRGVVVSTGNTTGYNYVCDMGASTINNSTFIGYTYTAKCPVNMSDSGLRHINIAFLTSPNSNAGYTIRVGSGVSYEIPENANVNVNVDTSSTTNAINNQTQSITNNQNQNTQSIINNQQQNTQDIINNQNQNTEDIINTFKDCTLLDELMAQKTGVLYPNGSFGSSGTSRVTDYIPIQGYELITVKKASAGDNRACFYNSNKETISCFVSSDISVGQAITIPDNAFYLRFSLRSNENAPNYQLCKNKIDNVNNSINDVNNTLKDDNINDASSEANTFFTEFNSDHHGLSGIITAPIRLLNSFTTASCQSMQFRLPFVHDIVTLPCMKPIYENYFGVFFSLYQLITTGLIVYAVMINFFAKVHALQNPYNDRIEVLNL